MRRSPTGEALALSLLLHGAALIVAVVEGARDHVADAPVRTMQLEWSTPGENESPATSPAPRPDPLDEPAEPMFELPSTTIADIADPQPVVDLPPWPPASRSPPRIRARLPTPPEPVAEGPPAPPTPVPPTPRVDPVPAIGSDAAGSPGSRSLPPPPPGAVTTAVVAAEPLADNPPPRYPGQARRRGWEGTVVIGVRVDATGVVSDVWVVRSSGRTILDEVALRTVRGWRFRPGVVDDEAATTETDVSIRFQLSD